MHFFFKTIVIIYSLDQKILTDAVQSEEVDDSDNQILLQELSQSQQDILGIHIFFFVIDFLYF